MSVVSETNQELVGFCSAPWTDCISYSDGALKTCDRNIASFGNWQESGLKNTWESPAFQEFRRAIREGRYPDQDCASCHNNGTQRTASSSLIGAYALHYNFLRSFLGCGEDGHIPELASLHALLSTRHATEESDRALSLYFAHLDRLRAENSEAYNVNPHFHNALVKLRVLGEALEDYLHGALKPRRVATFRQAQLQAKCTARCVMCAGLYTREIIDGPTMDTQYVDEAFAELEDVTDFWCNGAEYLFYKDWKKVALMLAKEGVKMRISTNGILLTESTIDFMLDHDLLAFLTMSLDAATKETMESTRIRVNFEKNMARIRHLLSQATERGLQFEFTAAFVMMKRNLHELPAFVHLIKSLMPPNCVPHVQVLCQPLENFNIPGYRQFVHREHHALLGEAELRRIFTEVNRAHLATGVGVTFYNQRLNDFMAADMPFPKYFPRQMDVDIFLDDLQKGQPLWSEAEFDSQGLLVRLGGDRDLFRAELLRFARSYLSENVVIADTRAAFPAFAAVADSLLPEYAQLLAAKLEPETICVERDGAVINARKYSFGPFRVGDRVYSAAFGWAGQISAIRGGKALLRNGAIVSLSAGLHRIDSITRNGIPDSFPEKPRGLRALSAQGFGRLYLLIHESKERLLGNVKSPLLWKLSVAYRALLAGLGVRVAPEVIPPIRS